MVKLMALCVWVVAAAVLPGCVVMAPPYPTEMVVFDEGLLGTWGGGPGAEGALAEMSFTVERREVGTKDGKLMDVFNAETGEAIIDAKQKTVAAYRLRLEAPRKDREPRKQKFDAVLLDFGGTRLLAFQLSGEDAYIRENYGMVLPVHMVMKLERRGDEVTTWSLKHQIVWLPGIEPLGGRAGPPALPEKDGLWVAANAEEFIALLKQAAATPGCWQADPTKAVRKK